MVRINRDPNVTRYLRDPPGSRFSRGETEQLTRAIGAHWDEHRFGLYGVMVKETDDFIGYIGFATPTFLPEILPAVEIGWRLDAAFWARGLATEGARACLPIAFEDLGLDSLVSIGHVENAASIRVMRKLEMRHERDTLHPRTGWPLSIYRLTKTDWERERARLRG